MDSMRQPSRQRYFFSPSRFTPTVMLPVCLLGKILVVQLKNRLKFHFDYQILKNLLKKNVKGSLRRPGVACNNNATFAFEVSE